MAYRKVTIDQLQPGQYVVQVLEQTGQLAIKHAGWVRTASAIAQLRQQGVLAVAIDPARQLSAKPAATTTSETETEPAAFRALFADELPKAQRVLDQTKAVQKHILLAAKNDDVIDLSLVHQVSAGLTDAVSRNPDVLLCLNRIAEQSDQLLQHSMNCAVYMAAFARYLNLPKHKVQDLVSAALLHDVGKAQNPSLLHAEDAAAINTSLAVLQRSRSLAGVISLWISQHCAYLDGSGFPAISGPQLAQGSKMLNIVNHYENRSSASKGFVSPLHIARELLGLTPEKLDNDLVQLFIKCIGIYPPGTVVKLQSGKLALVLENSEKKPTAPKVKVFYHSQHHHHIPAKVLDLSRQQEEQIESCVDLKKYGLDIRNYL